MRFRFSSTAAPVAVVFLTIVLCLPGCDWMKSTWRDTSAFVNPNPEIDYNNYHIDDPSERRLAYLFTPVDAQLTQLMRYVESQDSEPPEDWFELLFLRFPWISGALTVDGDGQLLLSYPGEPPASLNVDPLVNTEDEWRSAGVQAYIDYTDDGPIMYLAMPYFSNTEWQGLTLVHFDPRSLLNTCPEPEDIIIMQPGNAVWSIGPVDADELLAQDWESLLADEVQGDLKIGDKTYFWFCRYIGEVQIVYLSLDIPDEDEDGWLW